MSASVAGRVEASDQLVTCPSKPCSVCVYGWVSWGEGGGQRDWCVWSVPVRLLTQQLFVCRAWLHQEREL